LRLTSNIRGVWAGSKRYIPIDLDASAIADQAVYLKNTASGYRAMITTHVKLSASPKRLMSEYNL
jgi:hypothetical protein